MIDNKNKTTSLAPETIELLLKDVQKQFGRQALRRFAEGEEVSQVETISSGSILVDQILGVGGYPRGRITEIYGPESSGKTTLGLHAIVEVQKQGGLAAFLDIEHALDALYAKNLGVELKDLLISQPENGEQALDILEALLKAQLFDIIVLDSVAALTPKAELEGDMSEQGIGLQARLMSKALRKINGLISQSKTIVIFINQLREKVGVIFGNPETTPGGRALRFYATVRLEVRRGETIMHNGTIIANRAKIKVVKNKVAPPFRSAIVTINYNRGIDTTSEIFDLALAYRLLTKNGVWYSQENERLGQGKQAVFDWWHTHPNQYQQLVKTIKNLSSATGNEKTD